GCPWRDLPSQYGPYTTVYNRFNRWSKAGIWDTVMEAVADAHGRRSRHGGWDQRAGPPLGSHA
ncbi:MAG: transposase, partial [Gammaproteobacteria bacterium]